MEGYLPRLSERGRRWARFVGLLAGLVVLVWVARALRPVLTPLVAALALAYVLNPPVTWLERRRGIRRATSVSVGLAVVVLTGATLLLAGTAQIVQLAGNAAAYTQQALGWLGETFPGLLPGRAAPATAAAGADGKLPPAVAVPDVRDRLVALAAEHGGALVAYVARFVSDVFYWLSLTVLLPLYTFVFLLKFNDIVQTVRAHLPARYRPAIVRITTTIDGAIATFFRGRLLVCLLVGVLTGVGWLIVGVPYNLALGALAGALNLVPFLSVLALPPALLLTYLRATQAGENWVLAMSLVLVVYLAVQAVESFLLTPAIEARASGLHPLTTVVALLIGGQLAGLLGMLLAIPVTSTLKSLASEYLLPEIRRLARADETPVACQPGAPPAATENADAAAAPRQPECVPPQSQR